MAKSKVSMKLLFDSTTKTVLFAEVSKECADFLFYILSLPIATVVTLLREQQGMVGCLANLYRSLEVLNETYIQTGQNKSALLELIGTPPACGTTSFPLLPSSTAKHSKKLYQCRNNCCGYYYSDDQSAACLGCHCQMTRLMTFVTPPGVDIVSGEGGFVKEVVTYMVMDDLVVTPMSTISSLSLINKYGVKDVGALKEKVVYIGMKEAVKLLKTSLHSDKVLTEVFLNNESL